MVLPHSASSRELLSPSSSSLLVYRENYKWSLELIYLLQTTASPPTDRERDRYKEIRVKKERVRQKSKTKQMFFMFHHSV